MSWIEEGLKKPGKSKKGLADALHKNPSMVSRLLQGTRQLMASEVPIVAEYLEVTPPSGQVTTYPAEVSSDVDLESVQPALVPKSAPLPVYASAEGGPDGMTVTYEKIDEVPRPAPLANVRNAFAMYVVNNSMEPRYEHGDMIMVNPAKPPYAGDYVLIIRSKDHGAEHNAMVKRLVRMDSNRIVVEQFNPPEQFEIERAEVESVFMVIGAYGRRGA